MLGPVPHGGKEGLKGPVGLDRSHILVQSSCSSDRLEFSAVEECHLRGTGPALLCWQPDAQGAKEI
jgi:hypothetical protein